VTCRPSGPPVLHFLFSRHPIQKSWWERQVGRPSSNSAPSLLLIPEAFQILCAHLKGELQIEIRRIRRRVFDGSIAISKSVPDPDIAHRLSWGNKSTAMFTGRVESRRRNA